MYRHATSESVEPRERGARIEGAGRQSQEMEEPGLPQQIRREEQRAKATDGDQKPVWMDSTKQGTSMEQQKAARTKQLPEEQDKKRYEQARREGPTKQASDGSHEPVRADGTKLKLTREQQQTAKEPTTQPKRVKWAEGLKEGNSQRGDFKEVEALRTDKAVSVTKSVNDKKCENVLKLKGEQNKYDET